MKKVIKTIARSLTAFIAVSGISLAQAQIGGHNVILVHGLKFNDLWVSVNNLINFR